MRYRSLPRVVEALQLTWGNWSEMCKFADVGPASSGKPMGVYLDKDGAIVEFAGPGTKIGMLINTANGEVIAAEGDYVVRDIEGKLYPCKQSVFEKTYEIADVIGVHSGGYDG